ncbi:hypothetical protein BN2127_JRS9_02939 [Bacillus subtilis]|uniref:Holin-like toxin n=1 Tax=Bacillus subtilis subsp. natto TaxID=86029 RepID=E9RJ64_BACNA|nr:hypothetical protein S100333_04506 [Bacillus subtilis subsp. subtilis]BAJ76979.1 hypothetical protein [Bacillus subtilis subsp. natto]CAI6330056.1 hypothetical protein NRS6190_21400 [Bacillus subtilis]CUB20928.1 hypothetical protein BN2127_JRS2_03489 [Bacillus subtilis]CUB57607.1 hypothetical protein BN2127_JRS9_02939 [Bacillus subtilis]
MDTNEVLQLLIATNGTTATVLVGMFTLILTALKK